MDPVTHAVIGMSIAKFTGNEIALSNPATMGVIIGAVFPDIDILMQKWGDYVYLKNHRGVTHSVFGMVFSALFIAVALEGIYNTGSILSLALWALIGCFSHTFIDIFNSYGAKILWPFVDRKFTLSLLIIFDPIFVGTLIGYILSDGTAERLFLLGFILYLVSRAVMRMLVSIKLKKEFVDSCHKISILPSMTGLFRWHFILERSSSNSIGEINVISNSIRIVKDLYKIKDRNMKKILNSPIGEFFSEFTPLFHINSENLQGITRYIFIDMRYYLKDKFLHHAVLEMDENDSIIRSTFNPYSINRSVEL
ncbi:MAG: metal-dependent hydrolase [Clostridia bacterium]|nr:metal-dependent hydrolase [Clostridia bacterium]